MHETINLKAYREQVIGFAKYPAAHRREGAGRSMLTEAGEVADLMEGLLRGKYTEEQVKQALPAELGDLAWGTVVLLADDALPSAYTAHPFPAESMLHDFSGYLWDALNDALGSGLTYSMWCLLATMARYCGTTLQAVLDANVAKLNARHGAPDKPEWVAWQEHPMHTK